MRTYKNYLICLLLIISSTSIAETNVSLKKELEGTVLNVVATAVIEVPADQVQLSLGVVSEDERANEAISKNSYSMEKLISALNRMGLKKSDYKTNTFSVQPKYSYNKFSRDENKIIGYTVTNTLNISSDKLDKIGEIIDEASKAGANNINSISFSLKNARTSREAAIKAASSNAMEDAKILAESAGLKLKKIISLNVDNAYSSQSVNHVNMFAEARAVKSDFSPQIHSGDIKVTATVNMSYLLE